MRTKIHGETWRIEVISPKEMRAQSETDECLAGLCIPEERRIYIESGAVDYITVAHELFHAYFSYLHLDDTNGMKIADIEEIAASHFASRADEMVKKAKRIFKKLIKESR